MSQEESQTSFTDGEYIRVYVGEERFSPIEYHSFSIGGFGFTTQIKPGETPEQAFERAFEFLQAMKKKHFAAVRADFFDRFNDSRVQ